MIVFYKNPFSNVTSDCYTRRYEINPEMFEGLSVIVYAECYPNRGGEEKCDYYHIHISFSVNDCLDRDHVDVIPFAPCEMPKDALDEEMDEQVERVINGENFYALVQEYLAKKKLWLARIYEAELNGEETWDVEDPEAEITDG